MITTNKLIINSLNDTINKINLNSKPVIFWDTCAFIDIIRLPIRNEPNNIDKKLIEIKNLIVNDEVFSLSSERCIKELIDNFPLEIINYRKEISSLCKGVNKHISYINNSGILENSIPEIDLSYYKMEEYFCEITQTILDKTIFIQTNELFSRNAETRLINKTTPAKKKNEFKDCYIWETCLQTRISLINKVISCIFISSNIEDYTDRPNVTAFSSDIQAEVITNNIKFAKDFNILYKFLFS